MIDLNSYRESGETPHPDVGDELPACTVLLHGQYTIDEYLNSGGLLHAAAVTMLGDAGSDVQISGSENDALFAYKLPRVIGKLLDSIFAGE